MKLNTRELLEFWRPMIKDAGNSWSIGTFGAIGEFHRTKDEPFKRYDTDVSLGLVTDKGGIRVEANIDLDIVPFDNLNSDGESWNQSVIFCAQFEPKAPNVITSLGEDHNAIRNQDRSSRLFDVGVGLGLVQMCVRTSDANLIAELDKATGQSLFGPSASAIMKAFYAAQPHRILLSPVGRVEVYQDIPQPDGNAPEGPHTHLLPKLLAKKRTHSANSPIPDGLQPVLNLHPRSPWRDGFGKRTKFNVQADDAFEAILVRYALPDDRDVRLRVERAIALGLAPTEFDWPQTRRARTEARVTLRRMAARRPELDITAWRSEYDRAPVETDEEPAGAHA